MPGSQIPALTARVAGRTRRPCPEWDEYIFCLAREAEGTAATGVLGESAKLKWEHCPHSLIMEKAYKEGRSCPPSPLVSRRPLLAAREKATCNMALRRGLHGRVTGMILQFHLLSCLEQNTHKRNEI